MQFEGQDVVGFQVKLPAATVEADQPFNYGTKIRLALEVRVKGIQYKEDANGLLSRIHHFGVEDIQVVSTYSPSQEVDQIDGDGGVGELTGEEAEELGIEIKRSSGTWPKGLTGSDPDPDGIDGGMDQDLDEDLLDALKNA